MENQKVKLLIDESVKCIERAISEINSGNCNITDLRLYLIKAKTDMEVCGITLE